MTFKYKDTNSLKVKGWVGKYAHGNIKKAGVARINIRQSRLQSKEYYHGKRRLLHYEKRSINQENIIILNVYVLNNGASRFSKIKP